MKRVGDLFKDLGFNESGSDDVKIAFIKNLIRSAYGVEIQGPSASQQKSHTTVLAKLQATNLNFDEPKTFEQLSFDFGPQFKKAN